MSGVDFFLLMAAIYLSPRVSPRVGFGLGIACTLLAALFLVVRLVKA